MPKNMAHYQGNLEPYTVEITTPGRTTMAGQLVHPPGRGATYYILCRRPDGEDSATKVQLLTIDRGPGVVLRETRETRAENGALVK